MLENKKKQIPSDTILTHLLMAGLLLAYLVKHLPETHKEASLKLSCYNKQKSTWIFQLADGNWLIERD